MSQGELWVGEIDVHDDALLRRYWEAGREAADYQRPYSNFWPYQVAVVAFRSETNSMEQHALAAIADGEIVGTDQVGLPLLDNPRVAYIEPLVRPSARGRGVGAALLEASLALIRAKGRSTVIAEVYMPLDGPSPGFDFLTGHGFETAILDIHRVLDLPVDERRLDDEAGAAAAHHRGYELVTFGDAVPEEYLEGFCRLNERFNEEAPMGGLDIEPERWDADRIRAAEARHRQQGRHSSSTIALAPDGSAVALTVAGMTDSQPERGWQAITLVLPEHRGHRLGMAIKVANLQAYVTRFPAVRLLHSFNADENAQMVAINDMLGFRAVERLAELQLKL